MATTTGLRISQASAICDGVAACASATWRSAAIRSVAFSRFSGRKCGVAGPDPVRRAVDGVVLAGEQALRERAVGDDDPAVRLGVRHQVAFWPAVGEAVPDLVAQHPGAERVFGRDPAAQRVVADAHLVDQPCPLQRAHAAHDRPIPDSRVGLVNLVQVELARAEPAGARDRALLHHRGDRHHRQDLRRQEDRLEVVAQRRAENPLAAPEPVDLGGVEQRDAKLERAADDGRGLRSGVRVAVAPLTGAELPGTEADLGDLLGRVHVQIAHGTSLSPTGRITR